MPPGRGGGSDRPLVVCDLTQSWSPGAGGGITTYLREKRDHVLRNTPHRLVQIVPGPVDRVAVDGRHTLAEVAAPQVRGSPDYRFILRTRAVRALLAAHRPDVVESLCPWLLPWSAIRHRRVYPGTALVAGYRTDFPNAHVHRVALARFGPATAAALRGLAWRYADATFRRFDRVYALGAEAQARLADRGLERVDLLTLGVDAALFSPARRDPGYRRELGLQGDGPLLVYAGRIDNEKRADRLVAMMRCLPPALGAALVMIGDGKLRLPLIAAGAGLPIAFPGFEHDRSRLARALASADIYVSAMADETFGVAVLEAQASGLPVVGVAGGAMAERVAPGGGLLGPVDDVPAMAANVVRVWSDGQCRAGAAARAEAAGAWSWRRTFDRLFGDIYPEAIARAEWRVRGGAESEEPGAGGPTRGRG